ncbi:hypothetical protein B0O79_3361 [Flavobacteriaceae bacterium MAR_2009_75]|nr:hypothetical protein B0O79_3361 [Flavobacteriaceae bacterium MAR_2009_75]
METQMNPQELKARLAAFSGTESFYKIPLLNTVITDGIQYLANKANCFWLVTDASVVAKSLMNRSSFITVDFKKLSTEKQKVFGYAAVIEYSDGNDTILETQKYHLADFPLETIRLFFTNNTLMLPSEY